VIYHWLALKGLVHSDMSLQVALLQLCCHDPRQRIDAEYKALERALSAVYNRMRWLHTTRSLVEAQAVGRTLSCRVQLEITSILSTNDRLADYYTRTDALNRAHESLCLLACYKCPRCVTAYTDIQAAKELLDEHTQRRMVANYRYLWPQDTHDRLLLHGPVGAVAASKADAAATTERCVQAQTEYTEWESALFGAADTLVTSLVATPAREVIEKTTALLQRGIVYWETEGRRARCADTETKGLVEMAARCVARLPST